MANGEVHTVVGAATEVAGKVVTSLSPQFLGLLCITAVWNLGLLWFLQSHDALRIEATKTVLSACTDALGRSAPVKLP